MTSLFRSLRSLRPVAPNGRLIVVEEGARGLGAFLSPDEGDETVVIAQGEEEAPVALPFRVMGRLAVIERAGWTVNRAVILVARRFDHESVAARELVAHAVLTHMALAGRGELALAAGEADADLRHDLLTLVETLLHEHERTPVRIRLRLHSSDAPPASGVRSALRPVEELAS